MNQAATIVSQLLEEVTPEEIDSIQSYDHRLNRAMAASLSDFKIEAEMGGPLNKEQVMELVDQVVSDAIIKYGIEDENDQGAIRDGVMAEAVWWYKDEEQFLW